MPLRLLVVAAVLLSTSLGAQFTPTHCQTGTVVTSAGVTVKTLLGCADAFSDNVLWHLDRLDQLSPDLNGQAYRGFGGAGAVIYVVDGGVFAAHDEFMSATGSRVIAGIDLVPLSGNGCSSPDQALQPCGAKGADLAIGSHGTGTASAAAGKNVGVAPEASVVSVRIISLFSFTTFARFDAALDAIVANAFDPRTPSFLTGIVSLSFALTEPDTSGVTAEQLEQKIRRMTAGVNAAGQPDANGKRFFFSLSAGNAPGGCAPGTTSTSLPQRIAAGIDGMVLVGGTTAANTAWSNSCLGGEVWAPAEHVLVASSTGHDHYRSGVDIYTADSGTSWSAPIVAGIAARMLQRNPQLTPAAIEAQLRATPSLLNDGNGKVPVFTPVSAKRRSVSH